MIDKINLLLVEDNPGDADLIEESLRSRRTPCEICHVSSGMEAMALLRREGAYQDATLPDLILMDLNMPQKDGREVLREIKADPALRRIPVIIMSSSLSERDIAECYDLQASAYIAKPIDLDQYGKIMSAIELFWLGVARYSRKGRE